MDKEQKRMEYRIDEISSLDEEQNRFIDKILDTNIAKKTHSSQLSLQAKETDGIFTLRRNEDAIVDLEDLSVNTEMLPNKISFRFVVPSFQRGYRWDEEMVKDLIDDIYANYKKYHTDEYKSMRYCLQPLVVKDSGNLLNEYFVIDGQQRLTTLSLILSALSALLPNDTITKKAHIPIDYESRPESGKFLSNINVYVKPIIEKKNEIRQIQNLHKRIEKSKELIATPADIDSKFMLNAFLYAYWFFYEQIYEEKANQDDLYFSFFESGWDKNKRRDNKRFEKLEEMILKRTTLIWYEITDENMDMHRVFENFNSGKIGLTGSELIKGIFMNPDNYIASAETNLTESLKIEQIMTGSQWDTIETELHNEELWDFIPHIEEAGEAKTDTTRIDAMFYFYVFLECKKSGEKFDLDDTLFIFKHLDKIKNERLAGKNDDADRLETMRKLWREVKDVYFNFYEWFNGDIYLNNKNSMYHRLSLLKKIILNTRENYMQRYSKELNIIGSLYNVVINSSKDDRLKLINQTICNRLNELCGTHNTIENIIKTTSYEQAGLARAILLAFNLSTLENATGYGGRFPFEVYKQKKWEKEHILCFTNTCRRTG